MRVAVAFDAYCEYTQIYDTGYAQTFDVVVLLDSQGWDVSGAVFHLTPISYDGLILVDTNYPTDVTVNHGDAAAGEFDLEFMGCAPACEQRELVRFKYINLSHALSVARDIIMTVSGVDDTSDQPVFRDCSGADHLAPMGGANGGVTYWGVEFPDGSLIINPTPIVIQRRAYFPPCELQHQCALAVRIASDSLSALKARFR